MDYNSIAISGLPGSGKGTLNKLLSEHFGWASHSVGDYIREMHRQDPQKCSMPFPTYWKQMSVEENRSIDQEIARRVAEGGVVIDGRYIHIFQPETFKIFITASLTGRASRVPESKRLGKDHLGVMEILKQREADEMAMGKALYGADYDYREPIHYNLILDSDILTPQKELQEVLKVLV